MDLGGVDPSAPISCRYLTSCRNTTFYRDLDDLALYMDELIKAIVRVYSDTDKKGNPYWTHILPDVPCFSKEEEKSNRDLLKGGHDAKQGAACSTFSTPTGPSSRDHTNTASTVPDTTGSSAAGSVASSAIRTLHFQNAGTHGDEMGNRQSDKSSTLTTPSKQVTATSDVALASAGAGAGIHCSPADKEPPVKGDLNDQQISCDPGNSARSSATSATEGGGTYSDSKRQLHENSRRRLIENTQSSKVLDNIRERHKLRTFYQTSDLTKRIMDYMLAINNNERTFLKDNPHHPLSPHYKCPRIRDPHNGVHIGDVHDHNGSMHRESDPPAALDLPDILKLDLATEVSMRVSELLGKVLVKLLMLLLVLVLLDHLNQMLCRDHTLLQLFYRFKSRVGGAVCSISDHSWWQHGCSVLAIVDSFVFHVIYISWIGCLIYFRQYIVALVDKLVAAGWRGNSRELPQS
jgi:hypothetical protein